LFAFFQLCDIIRTIETSLNGLVKGNLAIYFRLLRTLGHMTAPMCVVARDQYFAAERALLFASQYLSLEMRTKLNDLLKILIASMKWRAST
jgi:hypothetical protein